MRLIDADYLFDKLDENSWYDNADGDMAEDFVLSAPTIDPESLRPTAHWVHKQTKLPGGVLPVGECSLCECQAWHKTNFCPYCGAKMEN